jgi:flagellar basal-body rod modification protein FlgD
MTDVSSIGSGMLAGVPVATKPAGSMDQNDFLKLMTTQMKTQDPFSPMDSSQMVAQMAQFSQVAGISEINKNVAALVSAMGSGRLSDAANWIGRSMLVQSPIASPSKDGSFSGEVNLAGDADQVTVNFVDPNGTVLHSESLGAQKAGALQFNWDGKDDAGNKVANGAVRVVVSASASGANVDNNISTWTEIRGLQSPSDGTKSQLVTGLGLLSPEDALRLA